MVMRRLILGVAVSAFALVAQATAADFLITYPSEAALDAVAQAISGLWIPTATGPDGVIIPGHVGDVSALDNHAGEWAMTPPFPYNGGLGRTFRWNAPLEALTPYLALGGGTMTVDPDTGVITIMAGPITMVSPLPDDTPVRY